MAKKRQKVGQMKRSHSYKTKKRLEVKCVMLAERKAKKQKHHR